MQMRMKVVDSFHVTMGTAVMSGQKFVHVVELFMLSHNGKTFDNKKYKHSTRPPSISSNYLHLSVSVIQHSHVNLLTVT